MAFTKLKAFALCATTFATTGFAAAQSFSDLLIAKYKNKAGVEKSGGTILAEALNEPLNGTGYKIPTNFDSDIRINESRSDAPDHKMTWAGDAVGTEKGGFYVWMNQPNDTPAKSNPHVNEVYPERRFYQTWFALKGVFQPATTGENDLLRMGAEFDNTRAIPMLNKLIDAFKSGDHSQDRATLKWGMNGGHTWIVKWDPKDAERDHAWLAGQTSVGLVYKDVNAGNTATGRDEITKKNAVNLAEYLAASMSEMINYRVLNMTRYVVVATGKAIPPANYEDAIKEYEQIKKSGGENHLLQALAKTNVFGADMLPAHVGLTKEGNFFALALPKGASPSLRMQHGL